MEEITSYKGFDKNWQCRGYQFAVGGSYTHDAKVEACKSGFHACEYPLDVFSYYPPAGSKFAVVTQSGDMGRKGDDSKVASKSISIMAEISIAGLVKAAIEYTSSRCKPIDPESPASSTGDYGAASSTGDFSVAMARSSISAPAKWGITGSRLAFGTRSTLMVDSSKSNNTPPIRESRHTRGECAG